MCLPFFHKWEFKLLKEVRVFEGDYDLPQYHRFTYLGTCRKCGMIKRKVIKS